MYRVSAHGPTRSIVDADADLSHMLIGVCAMANELRAASGLNFGAVHPAHGKPGTWLTQIGVGANRRSQNVSYAKRVCRDFRLPQAPRACLGFVAFGVKRPARRAAGAHRRIDTGLSRQREPRTWIG